MAEYADAVVVLATILQRAGMPAIVQGFWTEHSERALPAGLSVLGVNGPEKDLLGRWKVEGSDTYARSYGGRVAKLQLKFAVAAHTLDERKMASSLQDWLKDCRAARGDDRRAGAADSLGAGPRGRARGAEGG